ncbi:hypothetical protein PORY_002765 [Pneumocystis oryctolagi]|uniref:Uncharacterized protein n=1 Tax=Pneumocystis oryctolagi TaxID=42067 RepID=A0ACB7C8M5_9ASCO|nr:hypothetical protein PORY_002765 [Pneumocystis oryctolagi]
MQKESVLHLMRTFLMLLNGSLCLSKKKFMFCQEKRYKTALAFYTAHNKSDHDIIGISTYSISPPQASSYFSKIACFCFEEQKLNSGESVDMPVFFFIDPDFVNDPLMRNIETITLSYTFFKSSHEKIENFVSK